MMFKIFQVPRSWKGKRVSNYRDPVSRVRLNFRRNHTAGRQGQIPAKSRKVEEWLHGKASQKPAAVGAAVTRANPARLDVVAGHGTAAGFGELLHLRFSSICC